MGQLIRKRQYPAIRPQLISITRTFVALHLSSILPLTTYRISHRPSISFIVSRSEYPSSKNQEIHYCEEKMSAYKTTYNKDGDGSRYCYQEWSACKTTYSNDGGNEQWGGDVRTKPAKSRQSISPPEPGVIIITCKYCYKEYQKRKATFVPCPHCTKSQS